MLGEDFSHNQLPMIAAQREQDWGTKVINRDCFAQWRALSVRLGMTGDTATNVKQLRKWMEQQGPVASVGRGIVREAPSSSRVRTRDDVEGRTSRTERSVRGRYDRSRSRDGRRSSLNRGSSGQAQRRTRDD